MPNIPETLMPPADYREMARAIINNSHGIHEFLTACEACGLPVQERRESLNSQVEFARNFLKAFYDEQS